MGWLGILLIAALVGSDIAIQSKQRRAEHDEIHVKLDRILERLDGQRPD